MLIGTRYFHAKFISRSTRMRGSVARIQNITKTNPATYQEDVASTLNNLGLLYSTTQRLKEAEAAYQVT